LQWHTTAFDPAALGFQPVDLEPKAHCRHSQVSPLARFGGFVRASSSAAERARRNRIKIM
jgi:hypothetical protein